MKKYKVTKEFMDALEDWRSEWNDGFVNINEYLFDDLPNVVDTWRFEYVSKLDKNKRFGAIINWINGEDVFEIVTPKYIVQRKGTNLPRLREYVSINEYGGIEIDYVQARATRFDDFEKAQEWANKHFEVVEVDE